MPSKKTAGTIEKADVDAVVERLRAAIPAPGRTERRMFGGVYFMLNGNMTAGVSRRGVLVRVGKDRQDAAVTRLGARPADMKGRRMEGYVRVDAAGLSDAALRKWMQLAVGFVQTLPARPETAPPERAQRGRRKAR
jgi:TfoX/Sxy family transcriptional regulator of competence genes